MQSVLLLSISVFASDSENEDKKNREKPRLAIASKTAKNLIIKRPNEIFIKYSDQSCTYHTHNIPEMVTDIWKRYESLMNIIILI